MRNYLYNGILLPDINTVWTDKTTYPYAIIFVDENDRKILHISPVPFIYETPNVNISSGNGSPTYLCDSSGWVENGTGSGYTGSGVKWTRHDIKDTSDNSIYLAASDPVLVEENFYLKSWLSGFALGLSGKSLFIAPVQKEPVIWEVLYDDKPEKKSPVGGDHGDRFELWCSSDGNKNRLLEGDVVRVTIDEVETILTTKALSNVQNYVEAGNKWLENNSYTDDGTEVYFWEYTGALRFYTRKHYQDEMPHVKLERAINLITAYE